MTISKRTKSLIHMTLIVLVLLVAVLLLVLPMQVSGRSPLVTIQHEQVQPRYDNSQQERRIREQERRVEEARHDEDQARWNLLDAYTPSSVNRSTTRYYNIQNAQSELDRAQDNFRMQSNDLYMQQRILESDQREQRLQEQRDQMHHHNAFDPAR